ncbi:MAG TPA: hypothetical protein VJB90_04285 [Candidatus Nanoarchaeia archaeon]|nr:hypothetical protein [Candidatus Nanoarchaeia archaeon]
MRINIVRIDPQVALKIFNKHGLRSEEVEKTLMEGNPVYKKVGGSQYAAIGKTERFVTVFFTYEQKRKQATITTAYPSDKKQIRSYKKIRGR